MGDNGKPELNEAQQKKSDFEDNPDDFINVKDLILAVKRNSSGVETLIAPSSRQELEVALMRITHQAFGIFNAMSHAQQQASKPKIVQPGGILNFARRRK